MEAGEEVAIFDLRHPLELDGDSRVLPGARWFDRKLLQAHADQIPRDRDIILYCT